MVGLNQRSLSEEWEAAVIYAASQADDRLSFICAWHMMTVSGQKWVRFGRTHPTANKSTHTHTNLAEMAIRLPNRTAIFFVFFPVFLGGIVANFLVMEGRNERRKEGRKEGIHLESGYWIASIHVGSWLWAWCLQVRKILHGIRAFRVCLHIEGVS